MSRSRLETSILLLKTYVVFSAVMLGWMKYEELEYRLQAAQLRAEKAEFQLFEILEGE